MAVRFPVCAHFLQLLYKARLRGRVPCRARFAHCSRVIAHISTRIGGKSCRSSLNPFPCLVRCHHCPSVSPGIDGFAKRLDAKGAFGNPGISADQSKAGARFMASHSHLVNGCSTSKKTPRTECIGDDLLPTGAVDGLVDDT